MIVVVVIGDDLMFCKEEIGGEGIKEMFLEEMFFDFVIFVSMNVYLGVFLIV